MTQVPADGARLADMPAGLTRDFDLFGDRLFDDDLHGGIMRLADERQDIFFTPRNGGQWVIVGRDAAFQAATDTALFSSDPLIRDPDSQRTPILPIELDPPAHANYRKIFSELFSAQAMAQYEARLRAMAVSMIEAVAADGRCDFVKAVAEPLPVRFFMRLMGFPLDRFDEFRGWVLRALSATDPGERDAVWGHVVAMATELIEARRVRREDDLISRLLDAEIDGRPPTMAEMQSFCLMLFVAGLDTVTNAMALIVRSIALDGELQSRLRAEPRRIPLAIEELMRRNAANTVQRFIARDTTFFGAPLRRGDYVLIFFPAANLDPRAFPAPGTIDIDRRAPHLAFGAGPHRCVGAQLARIELRVMLEELLRRLPPFAVDPERRWSYHTGYVFSIDSLPILWAPAHGGVGDDVQR